MLSVSTAAVPKAIGPSITNASPSPPTLGRKDRRSWNCEYTFPKRRCRPSSARKKIISSDKDEATIGIDVHCQTVRFETSSLDENSLDSHSDFSDDESPIKTPNPAEDAAAVDDKSSRAIPFVKSAQMQRAKVARPREDDGADNEAKNPEKSRKISETLDSPAKVHEVHKKSLGDTIIQPNDQPYQYLDTFGYVQGPPMEKMENPLDALTKISNSFLLGSKMSRAVGLLSRDDNPPESVNKGAPGIPGDKIVRAAIENFPPVMDDNGWDADAELTMLQSLRDDGGNHADGDYRDSRGDDCFNDPDASNDHDVPYFMIGFPNPPGENRCWLNATLHAMFALPLFDQPEQLDSEQLRGCSQLTKTLMALRLFWGKGSEHKQKTYQTVKLFKESMGILDESYPSHRQQDVSEFLTMFLNYLKTDFEKLSATSTEDNTTTTSTNSPSNNDETENIPDNVQNARVLSRSPLTPTRRSPLTEISPGKRKLGEIGESPSLGSPKSRKNGLTYGPQDLMSPRVNRILSKPTDPSYTVHTPPHRPEAAREQLKETQDFTKNPIDRYFLLHMMEHYSCKGCSKHRQRKVDNLMIYVDLPPESENRTVALDEAIKTSLEPEERDLTCGKCKYDKHNVYTTFRVCPKILMVQVNRYGMCEDGSVAKFNTPVEIPETLQLEVVAPDAETGTSVIEDFEPVCVIAHVGSAMDCGHYTSYVRRGNDSWYHYNDLSVTPMTRYEALAAAQTTAYVVFFVSSKI